VRKAGGLAPRFFAFSGVRNMLIRDVFEKVGKRALKDAANAVQMIEIYPLDQLVVNLIDCGGTDARQDGQILLFHAPLAEQPGEMNADHVDTSKDHQILLLHNGMGNLCLKKI